MCEPVTIGALTITAGQMAAAATAASVGLALHSQSQQAKSTNAANAEQRTAINAATVNAYEQSNRQGIEDRENQTQEQFAIKREQASRLATANASAAAAGIGGASVDALLLDLAGRGLEAGTTSETNYARAVAARNDLMQNIATGQRSQLAQIQDVQGPGALDYLGAGLQVAGSYYGTKAKQSKAVGK